MKQPLQALVVPDADPRNMMIVAGKYAFRKGEALVLCDLKQSWCSLVSVTEVIHRKVAGSAGVTEAEWKEAGYDSLTDLVEGLKSAWDLPVVHSSADVTLVWWRPAAKDVIPDSGRSAKSPDEVMSEIRAEQEAETSGSAQEVEQGDVGTSGSGDSFRFLREEPDLYEDEKEN